MNKLSIFNHPSFGDVQVINIDGKALFAATQSAVILGYKDPYSAIRQHCREDGLVIHPVIDSLGRNQEMKFMSEGNLYRIITKSKLPGAEKFEKWIFDEVLPSIRKTGSYNVEQFKIPTTLTGALRLAADIEDKRLLLEQKIEEDKPKTLFAEAVATSQDCILIGQLATMLKQNGVNIGQTRLFNYLREEGYLCKAGDRRNLPTQRSMELRLFEVKEFTIHGNSGIRVKNTPKVTGRGQVYFINKFLNTAS